jgi:hypothetical protein
MQGSGRRNTVGNYQPYLIQHYIYCNKSDIEIMSDSNMAEWLKT